MKHSASVIAKKIREAKSRPIGRAVVASDNGDGTVELVDYGTTHHLQSYVPSAGDTVEIARMGGSRVVLGRLGAALVPTMSGLNLPDTTGVTDTWRTWGGSFDFIEFSDPGREVRVVGRVTGNILFTSARRIGKVRVSISLDEGLNYTTGPEARADVDGADVDAAGVGSGHTRQGTVTTTVRVRAEILQSASLGTDDLAFQAGFLEARMFAA